MKATTTVNLDVEVLAEAKTRTNNLSGTLNNMLKAWLDLPKDELPDKLEEAQKQLVAKSAELDELRKHLIKKEKKEEQSKKSVFI